MENEKPNNGKPPADDGIIFDGFGGVSDRAKPTYAESSPSSYAKSGGRIEMSKEMGEEHPA